MKLGFICTEKLPSPAIKGGAIQILIDGIAPYISGHFDLTIFSVADPLLADRETDNKIHYIRFPKEQYADHVAKELSQHSFDLIHVFNRPKDVITYKKASPQTSFILSLHNDMFKPKKITHELGLKAIESVERMVTVSNYIKQTVIMRFPEAADKIQVIYSGVEIDRFTPVWTQEGQSIRSQLREELDIEDRQVILFVGRLSRAKGPHLLIKAMKKIVRYHPQAVLVIAGGKWFCDNGMNRYVRYLYALAKPLGDHVLFTKYVSHDQIPDLYLIADVFVCSSQWQEPLARVHYEAMAAGIPLITTNRGGNAEIITHMENGLIINDYDRVSNYVDAIDYLLSNPDTAEVFSHQGRFQVEKYYHFKRVAAQLADVYNQSFQHSDHSERTRLQLNGQTVSFITARSLKVE